MKLYKAERIYKHSCGGLTFSPENYCCSQNYVKLLRHELTNQRLLYFDLVKYLGIYRSQCAVAPPRFYPPTSAIETVHRAQNVTYADQAKTRFMPQRPARVKGAEGGYTQTTPMYMTIECPATSCNENLLLRGVPAFYLTPVY